MSKTPHGKVKFKKMCFFVGTNVLTKARIPWVGTFETIDASYLHRHISVEEKLKKLHLRRVRQVQL
jgi:hypothetical protein